MTSSLGPLERHCSPEHANFFNFKNRTIIKGDMAIFVKQTRCIPRKHKDGSIVIILVMAVGPLWFDRNYITCTLQYPFGLWSVSEETPLAVS